MSPARTANEARVIAIDGTALAPPVTGVGRSLLTTLAAYVEIARHPLVLLLPNGADDPGIDGVDLVEVPRGPASRHLVWPRLLRRLGARLLHAPVAALPVRCPCPRIATVHDLPWRAPDRFPDPGRSWRHRRAVRYAARHADAIITPSEATRRQLLGEVGRARARVVVVPHAVPPPDFAATDADGDGGPFLILGDARPRKNLDRVGRAHEIGARMLPDLPALQLVGPGFEYVTEAEKSDRIRGARAVLHLALFEGFGLPVVEGFAHGVPVLCSDRASLPEVAGGAALIADPLDVEAMARAMVEIAADRELRDRLRTRGLERARAFRPGRAARAWATLHAEVAAS